MPKRDRGTSLSTNPDIYIKVEILTPEDGGRADADANSLEGKTGSLDLEDLSKKVDVHEANLHNDGNY